MKLRQAVLQGLLGLLLVPACLRGEVINLPQVEGARTVIFVDDRDSTKIWIGQPDAMPAALSSGTYTLLYYPWTPESLGLGPNGSAQLIASGRTQFAPTPLATYVQDETQLRQWRLDRGSVVHAGIEIPQPDLQVCLNELQGCVPEDEPLRCEPQCGEIPSPVPPALPRMTCPDGWVEDVRPGTQIQVCRNPVAAPQTCPDGEYQPGPGQMCAPFGACASGTWPPPPAGQDAVIRYVDAAAGPVGDGSQALPWRSLATAAVRAPSDAILLLSRGTHRGGVSLLRSTTLIGVCAQHTSVEGGSPVLDIAGASLTLSGLQIVSTDTGVMVSDGSLVMRDVLLRGQGPLLAAQESRVQATGLVTRGDAGDTLDIKGGPQVVLHNWDHRGGPGLALTGSNLQMQDTTLQAERPAEASSAIRLSATMTATILRTQIEGYTGGSGVITDGVFSRLDFSNVSVNGCGRGLYVRIEPDEGEGQPIPVVRMSRVSLTDIIDLGIHLPGIAFEAEDIVCHAGGREALKLNQQTVWRPTATIRRLWAESQGFSVVNVGQNQETLSADTELSGEDWVIYSVSDDEAKYGIRMVERPRMDLRRIWVHGGVKASIRAECAKGSIKDLTVVASGFWGLLIQPMEAMSLSRVSIHGGTTAGVEAGRIKGGCGQESLGIENLSLMGCPNCAVGVHVPSGVLWAEQSQISDYLTAGEATEAGRFTFRQGRVKNYSTGFKVTSEDRARQVVRGIEFDGPGALRIEQ